MLPLTQAPSLVAAGSEVMFRYSRSFILRMMLMTFGMTGPWMFTARAAASETAILSRLNDLVKKAPKGATVAAYVERANDGRMIFNHDASKPMLPASNQKILTTAAALDLLGEKFQYRTELKMRGTIQGEELRGDLVVVGTGDPTISNHFAKDKNAAWIFHDWAEKLKARGVRRITGGILGDDSAFDQTPTAPGWPQDQGGEWYCAEISALMFNDGCVDVQWRSGEKDGSPVPYTLQPPTKYLTIDNQVKTRKDAKETNRICQRNGRLNAVVIKGELKPGKEVHDSISVSGATQYFLTVLRETLTAEGIEVKGPARPMDDATDPPATRKNLSMVAFYQSPSLGEIVYETNLHSQNLFAEALFKTIGKMENKLGSFETGAQAVQKFLERHKIPMEGIRIADGSGLSRENRVTVQALAGALKAADSAPWREAYRNSFPIGGQTGSLAHRMSKTKEDHATAKRIRAKTGYIKGVRGLSGWATQPDGTEYRFSVILNSGETNASGAVQWIDDMALALAEK
ncbi:MAG: D-alanyl-D-alanine carboxypeptidase/D-alanyl-D-alanine-endopeptidase [Candidatus Sumerlaeota bacterium]|nr:D-alanyl-D-alanine carboxypeptidase/D-alanyl-D-alanine-endopeptidase [Candidatus Sumerlaeota bacterium]